MLLKSFLIPNGHYFDTLDFEGTEIGIKEHHVNTNQREKRRKSIDNSKTFFGIWNEICELCI